MTSQSEIKCLDPQEHESMERKGKTGVCHNKNPGAKKIEGLNRELVTRDPVNQDKMYPLIALAYMLNGGDGYSMLKGIHKEDFDQLEHFWNIFRQFKSFLCEHRYLHFYLLISAPILLIRSSAP